MSDIGYTMHDAAAAWLPTWKKSRLNWKLKVSNTADNAGITQSQACDTRSTAPINTSEPGKSGCSDWDAICVEESGGLRETPVAYSWPIRRKYCIFVFIVHSTQYSHLVTTVKILCYATMFREPFG